MYLQIWNELPTLLRKAGIKIMEKLDVIKYDGDGYKAMIYYEGWRVAFLKYAERFDKKHIERMERHLLTDEVFVLLAGQADLVIGEEQQVYHMEKNTIYNVRKAVWHAICVSEDAQVLIVENADTSLNNSEYMQIKLNQDKLHV